MADNPLKMRTTPPEGYKVVEPISTEVPIRVSVPQNPMPTPPDPGYSPSPILRSPLSGLLTDQDQLRQVYSRGVTVRRFWPFQFTGV